MRRGVAIERLSQSQREFLRAATTAYHASLNNSPGAEYLEKRGLQAPSTIEAINKFRLGYVAEPLTGHEMYTGMLAIPYIRRSAKYEWDVVSLRFRCINPECEETKHKGHGKYRTISGDRPRMYNTMALLQDTDTIAITEGEIDALTAQVSGIPAVGIPGAQSWQDHFREPFLGYRSVYILADGDEPGLKFADTVAKTLPNAKVLPMPPGEDVNSFVLGNGSQALLDRINK